MSSPYYAHNLGSEGTVICDYLIGNGLEFL